MKETKKSAARCFLNCELLAPTCILMPSAPFYVPCGIMPPCSDNWRLLTMFPVISKNFYLWCRGASMVVWHFLVIIMVVAFDHRFC